MAREERIKELVEDYANTLKEIRATNLARGIRFNEQQAIETILQELGKDRRTPQRSATKPQIKEMERLGMYFPSDISKRGATELLTKKKGGKI